LGYGEDIEKRKGDGKGATTDVTKNIRFKLSEMNICADFWRYSGAKIMFICICNHPLKTLYRYRFWGNGDSRNAEGPPQVGARRTRRRS
jgi:hypothetical protein